LRAFSLLSSLSSKLTLMSLALRIERLNSAASTILLLLSIANGLILAIFWLRIQVAVYFIVPDEIPAIILAELVRPVLVEHFRANEEEPT
jgi:hypothetical protein